MANAQVLVLVRSTSPLAPGQIQSIIEANARAAGFTPGPWTFDTQSARVVPNPGGGGTVAAGPWAGDTVSESIPTSGANVVFNTYRQNLLNGPDPSPSIAHWPMNSAAAGQALRALAGVSSTRISFRAPGNVISWDRGIPAPISLVATSSPTNFGPLLGILAIAGLAFAASRGSAAKPALSSWERRAATVASRTRLMGLNGTPEQHRMQAEYLLQQACHATRKDARFLIARAHQELSWVPGAEGRRLTLRANQMRRDLGR